MFSDDTINCDNETTSLKIDNSMQNWRKMSERLQNKKEVNVKV